ncbi:MAG: hypothetical protein H6943_05060 [Zoogloeaceae bacterium]|nr:hypothetical protein [Zoogloeaceae bacterium]
MKAKRFSVPIPPEIERAARAISAKSGCSVATVIADFIAAGQQKNDIAVHFDEIKSSLKNSDDESQNNEEIIQKIAGLLTEFRTSFTQKTDGGECKNCVSLPREAAEKLFEAAFFSSAVIEVLGAGDMPGAVRQPLQNYVRTAREKTRAQMDYFLSLL